MDDILTYIFIAPLLAFVIWGVVTAIRYGNWLWVPIQLALPLLGACLYFFFHLHRHAPSGFELPGAVDKKRIARVQDDLGRLDKAHLHAQLGDIYFAMGKLDKALVAYEAAYERDKRDLDIRAHLGACLVRLGRAAEARPLLEGVIEEKPRHDHGHTLMALAEAQTALGEADAAIATWKHVIAGNSYGRARVQLAELYLARREHGPARALLQQVLDDDKTSPDFHRQREAVWVKRARKLLKQANSGSGPEA
ncbi:MAG TPA: tetratricopeptide repeat protein [Kofleriaceae bacterium]|nr:tetratricopeptide repeat protein [Kofleriaceae bacterium]